ncbi:neurogenic protein mastermind-like [Zophobas morio]|uniref:neurogenic protein mastermind-like n=1 Tax=Zophobas morio TaxID=2755281 RepID=UPI00308384CC
MPRFGQAFNEHCEQNFQDTLQLKQRFLDAKAKRVPKTKDRKQESIQSSVHVQQKFLKRSAEENDPGASGDNFEPPVKLQCTTQQHGSHQNEGLTKFSVEIVQQLEFTTSAANSQPQQISTNVTVKAHTNASVKSDVSSPKSNPSTPASNLQQKSNIGLDVGTLVECVKQEPDNDFADLDQCAAALEKDAAANGGTGFGGFSDLIGEDTNDEIITSDAFNDLISDISNYPELMKDFDFEDKSDNNNASVNGLKVEDIKDLQQPVSDNPKSTHSPLVSSQNYSPPVFDGQGGIAKNRMPPYSNIDFCKTELSPAAQTLKQMAEQHQHKNQMGMSFNPGARAPNSRSPYPDFQFQGDYGGSPNSNPNFHKNSPNFSQPDMIKQEMIFQGSDFDMKRKGAGIYKQQYSPYSSPSASSHGSPGYLPRNSTGSTGGGGAFGSGTPPRPSSGPGGTNSGPTLQINQAQQLHITQQNHGHAIQVSAGQHLHLSGDLKGNVSIAAQQGMHFNQHTSTNGTSSQSQNTQNVPQQSPLSSNQQQNAQMHTNNSQQASQNQNSGPHLGSPMMSGGQQMPNSQGGPIGGMQGPANLSGPGPGNLQGAMGGIMGGPSGMQHPGGMGGNLSGQMADSYSMSQTQTINFTQQSLRQRASGPNVVPNNMGPNGPMGPGPMGTQGGMGPRMMNTQTLEQQKLLQQQQMLRAQQAAALQQHMVRPPPPDYKSSAAGLMQGVQPRFTGAPPNIRRMPHQPMPPSGPMIRPHNMYIMQQQQQQQHMMNRNIYPRQQGPVSGMEAMQHGSTEWRHLLMQQQNSNFSPQMRPNMQQAFNMNAGGMQLSAQHPQLRNQQGISQAQVMSQGGSPMSQMNNMNQMLNHMQQQNMMQQQNSQMSISNISSIHMQQSQSMTVTNQSLQQQNMNNQLVNNTTSNQNNSLNSFNSQNTDFIGLEFLDNLPTTDTTAFTDQELLNSFDSDSGFNLDF